jgi:hypothetical protein
VRDAGERGEQEGGQVGQAGYLGDRQVRGAFDPDDAGPGHARGVRELQVPGITQPGRADGERRGPLARGELRDDGRLVGGQVGGVVGLDVADGAVQVGAAAERAVDD